MALTMHAASDLHTTGLLWTACADLSSVPTVTASKDVTAVTGVLFDNAFFGHAP